MTRKSHISVGAAAVAVTALIVGLSVVAGGVPSPALTTIATVPPVTTGADRPNVAQDVDERSDDSTLSPTGMEHIPVFD